MQLLTLNIELRDTYADLGNMRTLIKEGGKRQVPCLRIDTKGQETQWLYESDEIINYLHYHSNNRA